MKSKITLITRLFIVAVASSLSVFAVFGQNTGDATTGDDAHPTTDSPFLRRAKAKPGASVAAATKLTQKDQTFLSQIAAGGVQAVEDAKVAQREGGPDVKAIASRIVNERGRSNQELLDLAKKKGIGLGTGKIKSRNMGKGNFDQQFIHTLSHDYEGDVRLLQTAASSSDDKDIKAWAAKTLPMVKGELGALKSAKGSGKAKPKE